jgi:hypothetical protein
LLSVWQKRKKSIKPLIAWPIYVSAKASVHSLLGMALTRGEETRCPPFVPTLHVMVLCRVTQMEATVNVDSIKDSSHRPALAFKMESIFYTLRITSCIKHYASRFTFHALF